MYIKDNARVLFIGDSVTDCGRSRSDDLDLGNGYVNMISAWFGMKYPEKKVTFLNRGISGNRSEDLVERWEEDSIDLKPDILSILIGINDTWRKFDSNDETKIEDFEANYRKILEETRDKTEARIVLCEPFVLPYPEDRKLWREDLDPKIQVTRNLALEFGAILVPFDGAFALSSSLREPAYWAADGVHPSQIGHARMAEAWLRALAILP